jgi:hypothetical protein
VGHDGCAVILQVLLGLLEFSLLVEEEFSRRVIRPDILAFLVDIVKADPVSFLLRNLLVKEFVLSLGVDRDELSGPLSALLMGFEPGSLVVTDSSSLSTPRLRTNSFTRRFLRRKDTGSALTISTRKASMSGLITRRENSSSTRRLNSRRPRRT